MMAFLIECRGKQTLLRCFGGISQTRGLSILFVLLSRVTKIDLMFFGFEFEWNNIGVKMSNLGYVPLSVINR
jgi:hypothetical protein